MSFVSTSAGQDVGEATPTDITTLDNSDLKPSDSEDGGAGNGKSEGNCLFSSFFRDL